MPGAGQETADVPRAETTCSLRRGLRRIPLAARMIAYGVSFLAVVLLVLPWLFHRAAERILAHPLEIGAFRWLGVAIFVASLFVYVRSSWWLTRNGRGAYVEFDPPREFVASGPYRWVRNPIAGSLVLMLLGESLVFSSAGIFLLFLLAIPLAHIQVVWLEEPLLRKRFGASYERYVSHVPRWIPRRPRGEAV